MNPACFVHTTKGPACFRSNDLMALPSIGDLVREHADRFRHDLLRQTERLIARLGVSRETHVILDVRHEHDHGTDQYGFVVPIPEIAEARATPVLGLVERYPHAVGRIVHPPVSPPISRWSFGYLATRT